MKRQQLPSLQPIVTGCRYIRGHDMVNPDYCNEPRRPGSMYCEKHYKRCHLPKPKPTGRQFRLKKGGHL
jgi:hypothetical protein